MGEYNNKIMAEFNPPKKWVLGRELSYTTEGLTSEDVDALKGIGIEMTKEQIGIELCDRVTVPNGFVTDLASVPRAMWWLIAPFDVARAAIIHDLLYKTIRQYRWKHGTEQDSSLVKTAKIAADKVFLLGMKDAEPKIPGWKSYLSWKAVDLFGNGSIKPTKDNI
tara:strand:+ start:1541 stop:2035 length:495 start_codon:yes stop_codon:yes gene_type:complete